MTDENPRWPADRYSTPLRVRPKISPQAAREVRRDTPLRRGRTCYGHLAGIAGVVFMDTMLDLGWLDETAEIGLDRRVRYTLSVAGALALDARGVDVASAKRSGGQFAFGCLDWTEGKQHLGGALGRALVACLAGQGYLARTRGRREVTLRKDLDGWFERGPSSQC
ncbi:MAG: hypothetical protein QF659_07445 [Dehalococcoidia bacterium]|nr:hypothetical protein [Dehalococcoidia bacterium]